MTCGLMEWEEAPSTKNQNGIQSVSNAIMASLLTFLLPPHLNYNNAPPSYLPAPTPPYMHTHILTAAHSLLSTSTAMRPSIPSLFPQLCLILLSLSLALALGLSHPKCDTSDRGSTLQILHVYSPCSPFKPKLPLSWEESVLQMQTKDTARLQFLSSFVARKSVVPIASGRQIIQSPTYIVRARIGTPAQTLLMAMDTSSDAAWIPCNGCLGCSSTVFNSVASTTFKSLGCQAPQCKQVRTTAAITPPIFTPLLS